MVGFDVETNHETGEPKLLTDSLSRVVIRPTHSLEEKRERVVSWLRHLSFERATLVSWRQFDHIALFRALIEAEPIAKQWDAIERYGRISPCVTVRTAKGDARVSNFKNSLKIEVGDAEKDKWSSVTITDASVFYYGRLESVCASRGIPYTKGARELHLIDWQRFATDTAYAASVLASNKLDAQVAEKLMRAVYGDMREAFGVDAPILSSAGSACKTALASVVSDDDYVSVPFDRVRETWNAQEPDVDEVWCMAHESYSGGMIDTYRLGFHREAWMTDIASAYPGVITRLPDLRNATLDVGVGVPMLEESREESEKCLTFARGVLHAPEDAWHTLSWRNGGNAKCRAAGTYRVTGTRPEIDFAVSQGCTFTPEKWVRVRTVNIPGSAPVAKACQQFLEMRKKFSGQSAERVVKEAANSLYGVSYEMIQQWEIEESGEYTNKRFRVGELYNPLYASYITGLTRMRLAMACARIQANGGKIVAVMTDSITWEGSPEMLPTDLTFGQVDTGWRAKKTVGMFEEPWMIRDYLCLGTGRYEYFDTTKKKNGESKGWVVKARGYRLPEESEAAQVVEDAGAASHGRLRGAIEKAVRTNPFGDRFKLGTSYLVSPGLIRSRKNTLSPSELGKIFVDEKDFKPYHLSGKRTIPGERSLRRLLKESIATGMPFVEPVLDENGLITNAVPDNTLPALRTEFLVRRERTKEERLRMKQERHKRKSERRKIERHALRREIREARDSLPLEDWR